jgi:NADPH:quinone reductase-like Zn-dependent oxidoreductase
VQQLPRLHGPGAGDTPSRVPFDDNARTVLAVTATRNIRPVIDRVFPFEQVPDALRHMESGEKSARSSSR